MARIPEYPPILMGTAEQKIEQLRDFLMRMVRASTEAGDYDQDAEDIGDLRETVSALQTTTAGIRTDLGEHERNKTNPHEVTAEQIGLGNVDNTADEDKPISTATQEALDEKANAEDLAAVATSGSYNDLTDRPVIPPSVGVDTAMSDTSENAVQNKVIKAYVDGHTPQITVDSAMSGTSINPVQNKVIKAALDGKQDKLTIDSAMSGTSTNPVQNNVIKAYVDSHSGGDIVVENKFSQFYLTKGANELNIRDIGKSGYTPIGAVGFYVGYSNFTVRRVGVGTEVAYIEGVSDIALTSPIPAYVSILYKKN